MAKADTKKTTSPLSLRKASLGGQLVLGTLVAELVGVFVLTFAALNTQGNPIITAITVLILVLVLSKLSGGHVNPVITVGQLATRQIGFVKAVGYIVAQLLGAMLAVVVATKFLQGTVDPTTGEAAKVFTLKVTGEWKPFFAEMVGALAFGFGAAAAFFTNKEGYDKAFTIGGALLLGMIVATSGSSAVVNPAVALGLGVYSNWWAIFSYAVGPLLGGVIGMWLYKLLQQDVDAAAK